MSDSQTRSLTVAVVAHREEDLGRTLDAVGSIADQRIVLATDKVDSAPPLVDCRDVQVVCRAWNDGLDAARNAVMDQVAGDWILWLHAGETMSADDARQVRRLVDQSADEACVWGLHVSIPPAHATARQEEWIEVRLIPRSANLRFTGLVRESLVPAIEAAGLPLQTCDVVIEGNPDESPSAKSQCAARRLLLADRMLRDKGQETEAHLALGEALSTLGRHSEAAEALRRAVASAEHGTTAMLEAFYGLLGALDEVGDRRDEQIQVGLQALEVFPLDAQLLCAMGGYLAGAGRLDLAQRSYAVAAEHGRIEPRVRHLADWREVSFSCLSLTQQLQGDVVAAEQTLQRGLLHLPQADSLRRQWIQMLVRRGQTESALAELDRLVQPVPQREALRIAVRGACLAAKENWIAADSYLTSAFEAGCRDPICLRWLAVTHLAQQRIDDARSLLEHWRQREPQNPEVGTLLEMVEQAASAQKPEAVPTTAADAQLGTQGDPGQRRLRVDQQSDSTRRDSSDRPVPHSPQRRAADPTEMES